MKLFELYHVSGNEHQVREDIKDAVKDCCDECYYDSFGNVIVRLKGQGKKILFNTGIDTFGMLVTYTEDDGAVRFAAIGAMKPANLIDKVCVSGSAVGIIRAPKEVKAEELKMGDLWIDMGCKAHDVKVGDVFALKNEFYENAEAVFGTNLTVKQNIAVLISLIQKLWKQPRVNDLYFAFTIQDRLGFKGAKVAANQLSPDMAIILSYGDCTKEKNLKWDGGSVLKIKDSMMISNRPFREKITEIFRANSLSWQAEILSEGGAFNSQMMYLQDGILTLGVSLPCKGYGSSVEMIAKKEIKGLETALEKIAEAI